MINDLKLGFKMMKYGHAAKLSFIGSGAVAAVGVLFSVASVMLDYAFPGGYFFTMAALLLLQLLSTVNAANLVQTSPMKKRLQTSVPTVLSVTLMLAGYLLSVVTVGVVSASKPEALDIACTQIIITAAIMGIIMLYYGACYKYFVASTAVFITVFVIVYPSMLTGELHWSFMPFAKPWENFGLTAVIGLAIVLVCGILQYLLTLAVYKTPISKLALGANLRRQM